MSPYLTKFLMLRREWTFNEVMGQMFGTILPNYGQSNMMLNQNRAF